MAEIKEILRDINPWWEGKFELEFMERDLHRNIQKFMKLPQIIAFTGLRRVGKTTLMLKLAEDSIKEGMDPKNIIYFSFDELQEAEIRKVMSGYEELMEKNLRNGKYLLLFDEIQKINNWANQIKTIYDAFKNLKIIISGSESLFIKSKSRETLAGRIFEFTVEPLSFMEFLYFKRFTPKPIEFHKKELNRLLQEFILTLGFPELVNIKEKDIIRKYIRESILEKVIYRDMQKLFNIKDASLIESLLNIFLEEPGQLVEISSMANDLKISRQTLSNYLEYLEQSFLIKKLYNFSKSRKKVERKLKKYYPTLISTNLLFKEDSYSKSKIFEWLMVNQLKPEFFWRDPYKNEVDMVICDKNIIPIEVKYGKPDTKGILAFMSKFKIKQGYIVSKDKEGTHKIQGKVISIIPAFKFLLKEFP